MLLNPDTVVLEDALQRLVRHGDEHPQVGVVGPALVSPNGTIQFVCARRFPRLFDWMAHYLFLDRLFPRSRLFGGLLMSFWDHRTSRPIEAVCGAGMLIPRRVVARLGLLDESHPMYLEDIDYCMRSARQGLTNYYLAEARILHYEAQSSRQVRAAAAVLGMEAHRLFFRRYGGAGRSALFRALVLAAQLVRLPASLIAYGLRKIDRESMVREWTVLGWALGRKKT